ncbi:hypothetical protein SOVF_002190 [Spinacia oleracea]|nr:hypothetical protein SOVF_002190 [Spinacia oleracea]
MWKLQRLYFLLRHCFLLQEAFRSVEDIHGLMCTVKKTPKPSLMVVYYAKLNEIFWTSGSHLYHAYAWQKLFLLKKNFNKNLSHKDLQTIASSVVLAALSVLPYDHTRGASHLELENEKERNMRMSNLINFNLEPKPERREVDLESDTVRNHLTALAESLNKVRSMIYPSLNKASKIKDILHGLAELVEKEHKKLLARKTIIEQRKEEQERQLLEKDKLTKQALMELALNEQPREKKEMEKKLQKLSKQMDYLERAKREEAAPLIESTSVHVRNLLWCSLFG